MEDDKSKLDLLTPAAAVYLGSYFSINFVLFPLLTPPIDHLVQSMIALAVAAVVTAIYLYTKLR